MANDANFKVIIEAEDRSAETKYFFPDSSTVRDFCGKVDAVRELSLLGVRPLHWEYDANKNKINVTLAGPTDVNDKGFDVSGFLKELDTLFVKEK